MTDKVHYPPINQVIGEKINGSAYSIINKTINLLRGYYTLIYI